MDDAIHHSAGSQFQEPNLIHGKNLQHATGPLWTVEDVAGYLKLQPNTIRGMARRGELPAIKIGKVWRFRSSDLAKILAVET